MILHCNVISLVTTSVFNITNIQIWNINFKLLGEREDFLKKKKLQFSSLNFWMSHFVVETNCLAFKMS